MGHSSLVQVLPPKLFCLQPSCLFSKFTECLIKLPINFADLFEEQPQVMKRFFRVFLRDKGFLACNVILHHTLCTVEVDRTAKKTYVLSHRSFDNCSIACFSSFLWLLLEVVKRLATRNAPSSSAR